MEEIHRLSLPWVRRITGGGAIWHYHELTYSLVCTLEDLGTHSVKQSFKILCDFLLQTYRTLGLEADFALHQAEQPSGLGKKTPVCFAGQEYYDILVNGRKLGGNAQRREGHKIFQHGSIPLELDRDSFALLFREKDLPVPDSITSLSEEGIALPLPGLTRLMKDHFVASLGITLKEEVPSPQELELARRYEKDRFCSNDWNLRAALS